MVSPFMEENSIMADGWSGGGGGDEALKINSVYLIKVDKINKKKYMSSHSITG